MAFNPNQMDDEDNFETLEDGPSPASTIAGPQTDIPTISQRLSDVRNPAGSAPSEMDDGGQREAVMRFIQSNALTSGLGRAANALAAGTGYKPDNSVYDSIDKQSAIPMKELDRAALVKKAVQSRLGKEAATTAARDQNAATNKLRQDQLDEQHRHNLEMERNAFKNADTNRQVRADLLADKKSEKELQLAVPGYERTGEVLPKVEEAQKFRDATSDANQLIGKLRRLRQLVKENGSFEYGGKAGAEMASLATEIQLLAKGPNMYALGVLSGPDLKLLEKITADPSSVGSLFTRDGTRLTQIDTQLKSLEDKLSSKAQSLGYRPRNGAIANQDQVGTTQSRPTNKPKTVTQNGHTYTLNESTGEYE